LRQNDRRLSGALRHVAFLRRQQEGDEALRETSSSAGECQHASTDGLIRRAHVAESGAVIIGAYLDPASPKETILLESACIGLQGLAAAAARLAVAGVSRPILST
jgi:hypothetical protein